MMMGKKWGYCFQARENYSRHLASASPVKARRLLLLDYFIDHMSTNRICPARSCRAMYTGDRTAPENPIIDAASALPSALERSNRPLKFEKFVNASTRCLRQHTLAPWDKSRQSAAATPRWHQADRHIGSGGSQNPLPSQFDPIGVKSPAFYGKGRTRPR